MLLRFRARSLSGISKPSSKHIDFLSRGGLLRPSEIPLHGSILEIVLQLRALAIHDPLDVGAGSLSGDKALSDVLEVLKPILADRHRDTALGLGCLLQLQDDALSLVTFNPDILYICDPCQLNYFAVMGRVQ